MTSLHLYPNTLDNRISITEPIQVSSPVADVETSGDVGYEYVMVNF
jgi:hypothetical protein